MKESKSAQYHSKISKDYDNMYQEKYWDIHTAIELSKLNKYLPKQKSRILDAGGGTGNFTIEFAKQGHEVILTDISFGMLEEAKKKIKKLGLDDKIRILKQDITNMKDLKSGYFDFVVSLGDPVSYCQKEEEAIKELARVAKSGSYVFITVDSFFNTMLKLIMDMNYRELENLEETSKTRYPFDFIEHNFKVDELKNLFEKYNLRVIEVFGLLNLVNKIEKEKLEKILSNEKNFAIIKELELKYSSEPSIIGIAGHIGIVGKKK
ncbi:MAG: class I SAM-dependent methyltransferase [Candidatus Helarchaeota archaeon]|nr:class I SAM-dependent methyltransferase [Candidatus Helarchaeota archaeon]